MAELVPAKYIAEFEKLGFGMFVHWGLYSQMGHTEWVMELHKIEAEEYKKLADTFTAEDFDAEKLVLTAKNAGCKYITFTTRHHDGFSLYDTCGLSEYDAPHSAAKRDLVREFTDACNKHDIVPFFYHTTLDWYNPDYKENFDGYLDYLYKSVEILCKNYGKIGGFWFDGNWDKQTGDWKEGRLYEMIRKYQPDAIIVNNPGWWRAGLLTHPETDVAEFENILAYPSRPIRRDTAKKYVACEYCESINCDSWGYTFNNFTFRSPKEIIEHLCNCRKLGMNYLLNIGPMAQGAIEPMQGEILRVIGSWMKFYGEAIYNGKPCKVVGAGKNFVLRDDDYLYLFFYNLSQSGQENLLNAFDEYSGAYSFGNATDEIESVEWMDNNEQLSFHQIDNMLLINATGYPRGMNTCVRVAKAKIKK